MNEVISRFRLNVKNKLNEMGKSQMWLIDEVSKIYDGAVNPAVISLAVNGDINVYPKIKIAIAHILEINF